MGFEVLLQCVFASICIRFGSRMDVGATEAYWALESTLTLHGYDDFRRLAR